MRRLLQVLDATTMYTWKDEFFSVEQHLIWTFDYDKDAPEVECEEMTTYQHDVWMYLSSHMPLYTAQSVQIYTGEKSGRNIFKYHVLGTDLDGCFKWFAHANQKKWVTAYMRLMKKHGCSNITLLCTDKLNGYRVI